MSIFKSEKICGYLDDEGTFYKTKKEADEASCAHQLDKSRDRIITAMELRTEEWLQYKQMLPTNTEDFRTLRTFLRSNSAYDFFCSLIKESHIVNMVEEYYKNL